MQTFLPYPDFVVSAKILDYKRLGKQRVEAKQILNVLLNRTTTYGWRNHPATNMWRGYENALKHYHNAIIEEWVRRGYKNNMPLESIDTNISYPPWFGREDFHASHRSNLLRKSSYYSKYNWTEGPDLPYVWP